MIAGSAIGSGSDSGCERGETLPGLPLHGLLPLELPLPRANDTAAAAVLLGLSPSSDDRRVATAAPVLPLGIATSREEAAMAAEAVPAASALGLLPARGPRVKLPTAGRTTTIVYMTVKTRHYCSHLQDQGGRALCRCSRAYSAWHLWRAASSGWRAVHCRLGCRPPHSLRVVMAAALGWQAAASMPATMCRISLRRVRC